MAVTVTVNKGLIGREDFDLQDDATTTFSRATSTGGTQTMSKANLAPPGSFSVTDFGAVGDGVTDDDAAFVAALAAAKTVDGTLYIPPGTYLISTTIDMTEATGLQIIGIGAAIIEKTTLTGPIVILGASNTLEGVTLRFPSGSRPGASDLRAVGIQLGDRDNSAKNCNHSTVRNVRIYRTFVGIQTGGNVPAGESDTLLGSGFSNTYDNLIIRDFYYTAILLNRASGNDTGDAWSNIYISGKDAASSAAIVPVGAVIYLRQHIKSVFNQLNIEYVGDLTQTVASPSFDFPLIDYGAGSGEHNALVVNSFHIEGIYSTLADGAFFELGDNAAIQLNGIGFQLCEWATGSSNFYNIVLFKRANNHITFRGLGLVNNTLTSGSVRWGATSGTRDGNSLTVEDFTPVSGQESIITNDTTGFSTTDELPVVKRVNDRWYYTEPSAVGRFGFKRFADVTIASGNITLTGNESYVSLRGEGSVNDLLNEITITDGVTEGQILVLRLSSSANTATETVTVQSGITPTQGGNDIRLTGDSPMPLTHVDSRLVLQYQATGTKWVEIARAYANNGAYFRTRYYKGSTLAVTTNTLAVPTAGRHYVDNSGGTLTVNTITAPSVQPDGTVIVLQNSTASNTVTYAHGASNLLLNGATNFAADSVNDTLVLMYDSTLSKWLQIGGGNNT